MRHIKMVVVAQLVRASVCGTEGRGFESHLPPIFKPSDISLEAFFVWYSFKIGKGTADHKQKWGGEGSRSATFYQSVYISVHAFYQ